MRAAVVDLATNVVINIIVADASVDLAPDGCILIDVESMSCEIGWVYDLENNIFNEPNVSPAEPQPILNSNSEPTSEGPVV